MSDFPFFFEGPRSNPLFFSPLSRIPFLCRRGPFPRQALFFVALPRGNSFTGAPSLPHFLFRRAFPSGVQKKTPTTLELPERVPGHLSPPESPPQKPVLSFCLNIENIGNPSPSFLSQSPHTPIRPPFSPIVFCMLFFLFFPLGKPQSFCSPCSDTVKYYRGPGVIFVSFLSFSRTFFSPSVFPPLFR